MSYKVSLNPQTHFILSTSGSPSSIEKHNKALQDIGINLAYFTFSGPITADAYADLLKAPIVRGGAVTGQGLKSGIIAFLDEIDDLAKATGAVNTVINKNGSLHGYNTDGFGFESALRQHLEKAQIEVKTAVIYGNGGVSGVAVHILRSLGIRTTMTGRNSQKVGEKMSQLNLEKFDGPYDLMVNATPASSEQLEGASGLLELLRGCKAVFDHNMPEKDGKTNYLQDYCESNRLYFIPGKDMYLTQMIKQWILFLDDYTDFDGSHLGEEDIKKYWQL